jgi:16S rRNA (uracil1498-N3)-methyltransferase
VLRVPVGKLESGDLVLGERSARYVAAVHRVGKGERILLFDPERGVEAVAVVTQADKRSVVCSVGAVVAARIAVRSLTLLQGLGKGDKLDAIVRDATELGATRIVAVETARSVVRLEEGRAAGRLERWRRIAAEAARQSGRGDAPLVEGPAPWNCALALAPQEALKLCLWEEATEPLGHRLATLEPERAVAVAVGPEGGLTKEEVAQACAAGFAPVGMGPFILRTETVAAAVLGALLVQQQATLR